MGGDSLDQDGAGQPPAADRSPADRPGAGRATGGGVLHRLMRARNQSRISAGKAPGMPQHAPQNPARAAATAIARAGEALYGLAIVPLTVVPDGITLAEMSELLPETALFAIVEGPDEALGVVALDAAAVATLTEVQALGRVTNRPLESRRLTRSDAMICAEFVNRTLSEMEAEMPSLDGFEGFRGFRYVSHLDDPRPLMLMLEDVGYRCLRMKLLMGGEIARREVEIFVSLPECRPPATQPATQPASLSASPSTAGAVKPQARGAGAAPPVAKKPTPLTPGVLQAPIELVGILCRRQISLGELRNLMPGKLLPLPRVSLHDARLETQQGQIIAQGKLGESDGCHAVRVRGNVAQSDGRMPAAPANDRFMIHDLAEPPLRPASGPASLWRPGQDAAEPMIEPPIADLAGPDQFRSGDAEARVQPQRGSTGTAG